MRLINIKTGNIVKADLNFLNQHKDEYKVYEKPKIILTFEDKQNNLIKKVNEAYSNKIKEIASKYPNTERDTWPIQQSEWTAWVQDPTNAKTPFVDTVAQARGITREEMLNKIGENVKTFAYLLGLKQQYLDKVNKATTEDELKLIEEDIEKTFIETKV